MKLYSLLVAPVMLLGTIYQQPSYIRLYGETGNCPSGASIALLTDKEHTVNLKRGCWTVRKDLGVVIVLWDGATTMQVIELSQVREVIRV